MSDKVYKVQADWKKGAHVNDAEYKKMYAASVKNPVAFWKKHGKRIDWFKPYTKVKDVNYGYPKVSIKWYQDGVTNVCYNCVDRHLKKRGNQTAIIWEVTIRITTRKSPTTSCTSMCANWPMCSRRTV